MRLGLQLVQKMSLQCTVCGKSMDDIPEHADDEKLELQTQAVRGPEYQSHPMVRCPKCGQWVLKDILDGRNNEADSEE